MKKSIVSTFVKADYVTRAISLAGLAAYAVYKNCQKKMAASEKMSNKVELTMVPTEMKRVIGNDCNIVICNDFDGLRFPIRKVTKLENWNDVCGFFKNNYPNDIIVLNNSEVEIPDWYSKTIYCGKAYTFKPGDILVNNNYDVYEVVKEADLEMERSYKKLLEANKASKSPVSSARNKVSNLEKTAE